MARAIRFGSMGALLCMVVGGAAAAGPAATPEATTDSTQTDPEKDTDPGTSTRRAANEIEEIVVTVQRRTERLRDVPLSVTSQSAEALEAAGIVSIQDLPQKVPSLTFGTTGGWALPSIRGVNAGITGIGAESPIAIYIDGAYRSNPVGNIFDLPDTMSLDVLRGPQGTLFGRNATGGAISIHTRDPEFVPTGKFGVSTGQFGGDGVKESLQTTYKGFISAPLVDEVLAASASVYYQKTDGYITDDVSGNAMGDSDNQLYRAKLLYMPDPDVRILASAAYGELTDRIHGILTPIGGRSVANATTGTGAPYSPIVVPNEPWHAADDFPGGGFTKSRETTFGLNGTVTIPDTGTVTSITSYSKVEPRVLSNTDAAYAPDCLAVHRCNEFYATQFTETFQQELTFASEPAGAFDYVAGLFYLHDNGSALRNVNPPGIPAADTDLSVPGVYFDDFDAETDAYAAFGELGWQVSDRLKVIAGLRYSEEDRSLRRYAVRGFTTELPISKGSASFDSWTTRLSARYDFTGNANAYVTYSTGFKSGLIPTGNPAGDPVDPEKIDSYEIGAKIGTSTYKLNVSAFYSDYRDLQAQFFTGADTVAQSATAEIYGVELDGSVRKGEFELSGAISYLPTAEYTKFPNASYFEYDPETETVTEANTDADGQRLLKTPELSTSLTGTYSWYLQNDRMVQVSSTVFHSSSYKWDVVGRVKTEAYTLLSAQVAISPAGDTGFRVALWGKNLTNEAYLTGTIISAAGDGGLYGAPRQIGISVDYSF